MGRGLEGDGWKEWELWGMVVEMQVVRELARERCAHGNNE